jgi:hypothetical protein
MAEMQRAEYEHKSTEPGRKVGQLTIKVALFKKGLTGAARKRRELPDRERP